MDFHKWYQSYHKGVIWPSGAGPEGDVMGPKSAFVEAKWRHLRMGYIFGWVPQIKLQVLVWFPRGRVDL